MRMLECQPLHTVKNLHVTSGSPRPQWSFSGLVPGPSHIQNFVDDHVPYIKWCRIMHTVSLLHTQTPKNRSKINLFNPWLVESTDVKTVDVKGQLYIY